jgi:translation initiation factor 1 (eIF-1/SUI1)
MEVEYCGKCRFPTEYCEYSPKCGKEKGGGGEKKKIAILKKRVPGNRWVTIIRNLEQHIPEGELKEVSRMFSRKMACGSSIARNGSGTDDVVIQTSDEGKVLALLEGHRGITAAVIDLEKK